MLVGYVLVRATLGALVNPLFNGPDEWGHWEYIASWSASGGRYVTGVEAQQPAAYYALASIPYRITAGAADPERVFLVRLFSAGAGLVTCVAVWMAARWVWPGRSRLAFVAATVAILAPGHLFLLSSANNDPLAEALTSIALLAAVRLSLPDAPAPGSPNGPLDYSSDATPNTARRWAWWVVWLLGGVAAVSTKLSAAPALAGASLALLFHYRNTIDRALGRRLAVALAAGTALALVAADATLLARHPSTSRLASIAHFWPLALIRAPVTYVREGFRESFRTFWYAYDYAVRFPRPLEAVLAGIALALCIVALLGLLWGSSRASGCGPVRRLPLMVWGAAVVQIVLVVGRLGFADVLTIDVGGAAQAKAFFPALLPLALLTTGGLAEAVPRLTRRLTGGGDRQIALGTLAAFLAMDWASLAVTLWHHYRWWQVGA